MWPVFSTLHDFPGFAAHVIVHNKKFKLCMLSSFILFLSLSFHFTRSGMGSSLMWLKGECL